MPFPSQEWRDTLQQASFRGAPFFVEVGVKGSGRRTVLHQFPKSDIPYAEDMGRRAQRFIVTGYIIGPFFFSGTLYGDRAALESALEDAQSQGPGLLVLPTRGLVGLVTCTDYSMSERRIWGGYAEIEMVFVEAGTPANSTASISTTSQLSNAAAAAIGAATDGFNAAVPTVTIGTPTVTGAAMKKADLNECVSLINKILTLIISTVPSSAVSVTAQLKSDIGNLQATAGDQINAGTAAASLAACFADAVASGATLQRMSSARAQIDALPTVSTVAKLLAGTSVIYALSSEATIIGATKFTARDTVEALLTQMAAEFDTAISDAADRVDSSVYLTLIGLNAAVTQYLVTTEQPLPFLTTYSFGAPMPSLVLAQRLYADPSRADELVAQNHTIHPAFVQAAGVCFSQ